MTTEMDFAHDGPRRFGEACVNLSSAQTVTLSDGTVFRLDVEAIKTHEARIVVLGKQLAHNQAARRTLATLESEIRANSTRKAGATQTLGTSRTLACIPPYAMKRTMICPLCKAGGLLILVDPQKDQHRRSKLNDPRAQMCPLKSHFDRCQGGGSQGKLVAAEHVLIKSWTGSIRRLSEFGDKSAAGTALYFALGSM